MSDTITPRTPFAQWREDGKDDPHGDFYSGGVERLCMAALPCKLVAEKLVDWPIYDFTFIGALTAGKERLRWLSRKLYSMSTPELVVALNKKRATMARGDLSDDELANAFFLSESSGDLAAGRARILWLLDGLAGRGL